MKLAALASLERMAKLVAPVCKGLLVAWEAMRLPRVSTERLLRLLGTVLMVAMVPMVALEVLARTARTVLLAWTELQVLPEPQVSMVARALMASTAELAEPVFQLVQGPR